MLREHNVSVTNTLKNFWRSTTQHSAYKHYTVYLKFAKGVDLMIGVLITHMCTHTHK